MSEYVNENVLKVEHCKRLKLVEAGVSLENIRLSEKILLGKTR
jgi:hypothetical protein